MFMPFRESGGLRYLQFDLFDRNLPHAVFSRVGGVSPSPWQSLNLGSTVGDDLQRVHENRRRALAALGREGQSVYDVWQVHSAHVVVADSPRQAGTPHVQADAILTDRPGLTLLMRFADCVPVLLHDPVRKVVGIVHAGWQGTVRGVVREAISTMQAAFGSDPANVLAAIGPSIGPDHYEVGPDVIEAVSASFGAAATRLLIERQGSTFFDLWAANRLLLEEAGVKYIEVTALCTACHLEDWFSHRAEKGRTGRFGALIALE